MCCITVYLYQDNNSLRGVGMFLKCSFLEDSLHLIKAYLYVCALYIQGDSRLVDITAGGDFLGLCDQKSSYKHVSDFGRLQSYDRLKLGIKGNDY